MRSESFIDRNSFRYILVHRSLPIMQNNRSIAIPLYSIEAMGGKQQSSVIAFFEEFLTTFLLKALVSYHYYFVNKIAVELNSQR